MNPSPLKGQVSPNVTEIIKLAIRARTVNRRARKNEPGARDLVPYPGLVIPSPLAAAGGAARSGSRMPEWGGHASPPSPGGQEGPPYLLDRYSLPGPRAPIPST